MILWVAEVSARAVGRKHVYIATDDIRIADVVENAGFTALMTSAQALTGTDRLAEAAKQIDYDIYVNVQGDEPLVDPQDIQRCIELKAKNSEYIVNGFCWLGTDEDPTSVNIPKLITNEAGVMIYMSRSPLPGHKESKNSPDRYMKQVCIYGFNRFDLETFISFGRKSALELSEDIEILRFLELDRRIQMFECHPGSLAVDIPEDVARVEAAMRKRDSG